MKRICYIFYKLLNTGIFVVRSGLVSFYMNPDPAPIRDVIGSGI